MANYQGSITVKRRPKDGTPGKDAHSPYIGADGYWYYWDDALGAYVKSDDKAAGEQGIQGPVVFQKEWVQGDTHRYNDNIRDYIYVRGTSKDTSYWYTRTSKGDVTADVPPVGGADVSGYDHVDFLNDLAVKVLIAEEANLANLIFKQGRLISLDESSNEVMGINGIAGSAGDNPAFWAGGSYSQAIAGTAKAIIRHDGSVKFTDAEITGTISSNASGNKITIDAGDRSIKMINSSDYEILKMHFYNNGDVSYPIINLGYMRGSTTERRVTIDAVGLQCLDYEADTYSSMSSGLFSIGTSNSFISMESFDATNNMFELRLRDAFISGLSLFTRRTDEAITLTERDSFIVMINSTWNTTIKLPVSPATGRTVYIKRTNKGVTVNGNGKTIYTDGSTFTNKDIPGAGDVLMCVFDGIYWQASIF